MLQLARRRHAVGKHTVMAATGILSRLFLYGTQRPHVDGLADFVKLLEDRSIKRSEGLVTVSNHISVLDDPLMWGLLPFSRFFSPPNLRYSLGSADICFTNKAFRSFFSLGQVLPTYRLHKDPRGGLFQPTMDRAIQILSDPKRGWVHMFPEGRIHQHPSYEMRYFKWGISRLLLEPPTLPTVVPVFLTGFSEIMNEARSFPRFIPRLGKKITLHFGDPVPASRFSDLRDDWAKLCLKYGSVRESEYLKTGEAAVALRVEATKRVREEVVKLRRKLGFPEEEEGAGDWRTYRKVVVGTKEAK